MKISIGDTFVFEFAERDVFLQYLGEHPSGGTCVCIWREAECGEESHQHLIFYPLALSLRKRTIRFHSHSLPKMSIPSNIRRPGIVRNKIVEWWFIDIGEETYRSDRLSEEEMSFPVEAIMSHAVVMEWLAGGWKFLFGDAP